MLATLSSTRRNALLGSVAVLSAFAAPQAFAAGTIAGTVIPNTATASYVDSNNNQPATVTSNTVNVQVDEILGVTVVSNNAGPVTVATPDNDKVLSFTTCNPGNGQEAYLLTVANSTVTPDQFNPNDYKIYLDSNANGVYDVVGDALYVPGTNNPDLAPDACTVVFVTADIPAGQANGNLGAVTLTSTAVTGSGAPGTTFPGAGTAGSDAVVGPTTATANADGRYLVTQLSTSLVKSQTVADPFGGTNAVPGATITYTLNLTASGTGSLNTSAISDVIPANTTYVAGSLKLNSTTLTDAADADAGRFTGTAVEVNLGNLTAPTAQSVEFKVTIN